VFRAGHDGYRRTYVDLPGMAETPAREVLDGNDAVFDLLIGVADDVGGDDEFPTRGRALRWMGPPVIAALGHAWSCGEQLQATPCGAAARSIGDHPRGRTGRRCRRRGSSEAELGSHG
jgi:hypothetical protein